MINIFKDLKNLMSSIQETQIQKNISFNTSKIEKLIQKYPDKVPIFVNVNPNSKNRLELYKNKYLVPRDLNSSLFLQILKKKTNIDKNDSLYIFIKNNKETIMLNLTLTCGEIYNQYLNEDKCLHLMLCKENVFG